MVARVVIITAVAFLVFRWWSALRTAPGPAVPAKTTGSPVELKTVSYAGRQYAYSLFRVAEPSGLELIVNPSDTEGVALVREYGCIYAANAGYYDTADRPLGLWMSGGETVYPHIQSQFLNAYIWIDKAGSTGITRDLPNISFQTILQTGPLLWEDGQIVHLSIKDDKHARRVIAFHDRQALWFAIIYDPESRFDGPLLKDLPAVLGLVTTSEGLNVLSAINLDGGSASFFKTPHFHLNEFRRIGGLFCYR